MNELKPAVMDEVGPLEEDEEIIGSFECRIDYMRGFLVCTNKGIKFIQGGGRYERCFKKLFEAPYSKLDIGEEANTKLILTIEGLPYRKRLEPIGLPIRVLEEMLSPYVQIHEMPTPFLADMRVKS
jgi:hypothetical protein